MAAKATELGMVASTAKGHRPARDRVVIASTPPALAITVATCSAGTVQRVRPLPGSRALTWQSSNAPVCFPRQTGV